MLENFYVQEKFTLLKLHGIENGRCTCSLKEHCERPGKHPFFPTFNESADRAVIHDWLTSRTNVGLILGPISGVIDVEIDSEQANEEWKRLGFYNYKTVSYSSGRGNHHLFRCKPNLPRVTVIKPYGIECRLGCVDGKMIYSVLPPSRHLSGKTYNFLPDRTPFDTEIADVPDDLYNLMCEFVAKKQKPQDVQYVTDNTKSTGNFGRAKKYAATWKPVTENKNIAFLGRACKLFEKFNISEEQAYNLCSDNNGRSDDPLSGAELEKVVGNACSIISKKGSPSCGSGYPIVRTELYTANTADIVPLKAWRAQMKASRVASVKSEAGIFFDGSPVGAGKNFADITILKDIGASITLLPTHDACGELAKVLVEKGLNAAAHPAMNEATCELFGSEDEPGIARGVLKAGLNVGEVLCPTCKFKAACEYQKARSAAREADHEILTHKKAALNNFYNQKNKKLFLIHEDPTDLLRPSIKISDVEGLKKLKVVASAALERAQQYNFPEKVSGVRKLIGAVDVLLHELLSDNLIEDIRRSDRKTVCNLPSVAELARNDPSAIPDGWESFLYDSMISCNIFPPGNTVKLCNGFAFGEYTTLAVVVDTIGWKNPKYNKAIIGITQNVLPDDGIVWFEDASSTASYIENLLGVPVVDKTPSGRLANYNEPIQFATVDINKQTSGGTVRNIVRTLIARNKAKKVGIICHNTHKSAINKELAKSWRARIHKIEHFRSGKDKASNAWLDCDLLIILGTPRVPAVAIRDRLILLGDIAAANRNPVFGCVEWQGKDENGAIINISGTGYQDDSWQCVYKFLVKETLLQAIGRGRSVTEKAVPVVVVSNENINNLIISENPCRILSDTVDKTYQRLLTVKIPNSTIIGKVAVIKPQSRKDRLHCSTLHNEGLLKRLGVRRGYELL